MQEEKQPSYYAIIPAFIRYDNRLTHGEKLLYGEITALSNKHGYCFATNSYFAKLYGVTTRSITNWISKLEKCHYIKTEIIRAGSFEVVERKIYIENMSPLEKNF